MNHRLALTCVALTAFATGSLAGDRALVIGIDDYSLAGIEHSPQSASADANAFSSFLENHWGYDPSEIALLTNADATSKQIMSILIDQLVGETRAGDRVTFYFAGLGSRVVDRTGKEADGLSEVLLAYDAASSLGKIPENAIADILDIISDRDVFVIVDASSNGDPGSGTNPADGPSTRGDISDAAIAANTNSFSEEPFGAGKAERTVWNAAAPGQYAWEDSTGGIFTRAFINGIGERNADANQNGTITNAELLAYLRSQSNDWCNNTSECASTQLGLTPNFIGRVDGNADRNEEPTQTITSTPVDNRAASYTETLGFVTDLFSPSNDAGLLLNINDGNALKVGDIVNFSVDANRSGTLVLLDVNPDGELAQIFPSPLSAVGSTRMNAGETLTIPNGLSTNGQPLQIRVGEPAGRGFLLGLFIENDLPALKGVLPADLAGGAIPNAGQYLYEIAQELLQLQVVGDGTNTVQWSAAYLPYEIIR